MKKYMAYNREVGSCEGAVLVFANTVQEARKLAYPCADFEIPDCDSFLDIAATLIKGHDYLDGLKKQETPHVIPNPPVCKGCNFWGNGEIVRGLCPGCREEHDEERS